jgi:hypothetical protein
MFCMSHRVILLKVRLVNLIFFQFRNEGVHNIVTVTLEVESLREKKNRSDFAPARHSNPNTSLLIMKRLLVEHMGIVCTPDT